MRLRLHVSDGNMKLGKIPNISFPPVKSCREDVPCTKACYAMKAYRLYKLARKAWDENWELWKEDPVRFEKQLCDFIERKRPGLFRYFVGGDVPDQNFVDMMGRMPATTRYLLFTKRYDLDYSKLKENCRVILSVWPGLELPENTDLPWAWLEGDERLHADLSYLKCTGHCGECQYKCWSVVEKDVHVVFKKH